MSIDEIRSELHGTGIPVRSVEDAKEDALPSGLAVVVSPSASTLALTFQRQKVGEIIRTEGQTGEKIWQAVEVQTVASKDLHRVAFGLAALHPPLE